MRKVALLAAGCLLSAAFAQWLETTTFLPDSFGGVLATEAIAYNPDRDEFLVGSVWGDCVLAVDCSTWQKSARIPAGMDISSLCYNSTAGKVYAAGAVSGDITVIDAATNRAVTTIAPIPVSSLCCNEPGNKVYAAGDSWPAGLISVIDCAGDSLLSRIAVEPSPRALCHAPGPGKLYCAHAYSDRVTVLDGAGDTVLAVVGVGEGPSGLCHDPGGNKVYCSNWGDEWAPDSTVSVIDGVADTVVATVVVGYWPSGLCYNPASRLVYCARSQGFVTVIDCVADTVIAEVEVGSGAFAVRYNPVDNKVYCACYDGVAVIDCATNQVVASVSALANPQLCYNPARNVVGMVYGFTDSEALAAVDGATNQVVAQVDIRAALPAHACYSSGSHKVYCSQSSGTTLASIDAATNRLLANIRLNAGPGALCYCPEGDKVYCYCAAGSYRRLVAVNCADDQVLRSIPLPNTQWSGHAMCYSPGSNKLYFAFRYDSMLVAVDCAADTVLKTLDVGVHPQAVCYNPISNRVYTADNGSDGISVVDCASDSVIATIPIYYAPAVLCHNPDDDLLYCGHEDGWVTVIDAARNLPLGGIEAGGSCAALCWNPHDRKVYSASLDDSTVTIFDALGDTVLATVRTELGGGALFHNAVNNKVYCLNNGETRNYRVVGRSVTVIDGTTDEVLDHVPVGSEPTSLAWNPVENRSYIACYTGSCVSVIRDSMVPGIEEGAVPRAACTKSNATVVRGELWHRPAADGSQLTTSLIDLVGRKVMDLVPGENDVRHLAPGVYFVRGEDSGIPGPTGAGVRKVVVTD